MSSQLILQTRPAFSWAAVRTQGASHEQCGEPCQDAFTLQTGCRNGVPYAAVAIADGAGSARHAEEAAKLAARLFTAFVTSEIDAYGLDETGLVDLALDAANGVHCKLRRLAVERGVHADHFATTLLAFVATPERMVLVQIGDGGIVMRSRNDPGWRLAFPPHHGEFCNESRFITDRDAMDWLQLTSIEGAPGTLIAFTDGLEDLLLSPATLEVHPPLFDHIGERLGRFRNGGLDPDLSAELDELMVSGSVRSRTDDDTTLLAIRFNGDTSWAR